MNREIKNQSSFQTTNQSVYYAPVASTRGDRVEIYRFAFEEQCTAFSRAILNEQNSLQKSVIRYQFVKFIHEHYLEYSGDRQELLRGAAVMISLASDTIFFTITSARASLNYYTKKLRKLQEEYASVMPRIKAATELRRKGVVYSTSAGNNLQREESRRVKSQIDDTREMIRKYQSLLSRYLSICPDHIAEDIARLNSEFEQLR